ncbi:MAG: hypothetical protein QG670_500 [Thermoproteota archaeon]|nr:hypothetical protein [Thermoproteota archaeon]
MGELLIVGRKPMVVAGEAIEAELKLTWRIGYIEEVAVAEKTFKDYTSKGWLAVGEKSGKMTQIFNFDPTFDRIILGPMAVGG